MHLNRSENIIFDISTASGEIFMPIEFLEPTTVYVPLEMTDLAKNI